MIRKQAEAVAVYAATDYRLTVAFLGVVAGLVAALLLDTFAPAAHGEEIAWADLYRARAEATPPNCTVCGLLCPCANCQCDKAKAAGAYSTAKVREEDGDHPTVQAKAPPATAYTRAGVTKLIDGYWYKADGAGTWNWCDECNGITYEAFVGRVNRARAAAVPTYATAGQPVYLGSACATGQCGSPSAQAVGYPTTYATPPYYGAGFTYYADGGACASGQCGSQPPTQVYGYGAGQCGMPATGASYGFGFRLGRFRAGGGACASGSCGGGG